MVNPQTASWYKLENNYTDSGSLGSGNTLSAGGSGNSFVTGGSQKLGTYALSENGSGYANLLNPSGFSTGNVDFSIAYWVNIQAQPATNGYLEQVYIGDNDISNGNFYARYHDISGTTKLEVWVASSQLAVTQTLTTGTWMHVVYTYQASNKAINLYVNGSNIGSTTSGNTLNLGLGSGGGIAIGSFEAGAGTHPNAYFDDVRFYKAVLSSTDVSNLYNGGAGIDTELGVVSAPVFLVNQLMMTGMGQ